MRSDTGERFSRTSQRFKRLISPSRDSHMGSQAESTFSPSLILPRDGHEPYPKRPPSDVDHEPARGDGVEEGQPVFGAPSGAQMSGSGNDRSASPPSVFDKPSSSQERGTELTTQGSDDPGAYDLKAPAPAVSHDNIEALADRWYSSDHLDIILRDPNAGPRFVRFIDEYKSQYATTLTHYTELRKAITAIEYANAIAEHIPADEGDEPHIAATLDESFAAKSQRILDDLVEEALPAFLTHRMVGLVTDTLVKEITGEGAPFLKDLVPNLAEVFCISDPSLADNPIVYASEEFYKVTQYGRDYTIGRNCRFLQGPRTTESSVKRLVEALRAGVEICETVVNYRRDGTPFMNLLMIAPLYDNKGNPRYFLGAQIDISPLVVDGKGLDTFKNLLQEDRSDSHHHDSRAGREPVNLLAELGQMLNETEADFVQGRMQRSGSQRSGKGPTHGSGDSAPRSSQNRRPNPRRYLSMDDPKRDSSRPGTSGGKNMWPDASLGRSGRLPGVYKNYLLVRPYPSLRITFTSPTLRIPGLLQTKLLDRIGGPQHLRDGVREALESGTSITAKVPWLTRSVSEDERENSDVGDGKPRWIHCTPLFGSDDKVGVWMVILVENEEVTGLLNRQVANGSVSRQLSTTSGRGGRSSGFATPQPLQLGSVTMDRPSTGKDQDMYAEYLKSGRPDTSGTQETSSSARERREVDENFRDF